MNRITSIKKSTMDSIRLMDAETAMKNRGGVLLEMTPDQSGIAYFGETEHVEDCLIALTIHFTEGMLRFENDGEGKCAIWDLKNDIEEYLKNNKKQDGQAEELHVRDSFSFMDQFDEVARTVEKKLRPRDPDGLLLFAMMNGNKIRIVGKDMAINKEIYNRIKDQEDMTATENLVLLLYRSLLLLNINYLTVHTPCTKKVVDDYIMKLTKTKMYRKLKAYDNEKNTFAFVDENEFYRTGGKICENVQ